MLKLENCRILVGVVFPKSNRHEAGCSAIALFHVMKGSFLLKFFRLPFGAIVKCNSDKHCLTPVYVPHSCLVQLFKNLWWLCNTSDSLKNIWWTRTTWVMLVNPFIISKEKKERLAGTFWVGSRHFGLSKDCLLWKLCWELNSYLLCNKPTYWLS